MKKYGIVFASKHGQTRKIAEFIKSKLEIEPGVSVELINADVDGPSFDVDAWIIGAPLYVGRFPRSILRWVKSNSTSLRGKTTGFYSVTLNAADQRPEARKMDAEILRRFCQQTGLVPTHMASFAGALKYREYGWFVRRLMRRISASAGGPTDMTRDYEMTNWRAVEEFVELFRKKEAAPFQRESEKGRPEGHPF